MTIDRETIETLRGEPELLAIADAVRSAGDRLGPVPSPQPRRQPFRIAAVALVAAAVVAIVLSSPWNSGGPSFVDKALAAVGNRPVLHVVLRYTIGERIDLRTGRSSPTHRDAEVWYDSGRHIFRTVARLDGHVVFRLSGRGDLSYEPFLLTNLYRKALKERKVHRAGEAVVRGQHVIVVETREQHGFTMRAYLDARSYRLVRMQLFVGSRLGSQIDVLRFETVTREQAQLPKNPPATSSTASGSAGVSASGSVDTGPGHIGLAQAGTVFGRPALWPGRAVNGHRFRTIQVERVTESARGRTVHGRMLSFEYAPITQFASDPYLQVEEAPAKAPIWASESVYAPPAGHLDLLSGQTSSDGHPERTQWTGVMRKNGFFLRLTSYNRATLIAAARALRPLP